ncbi:hypothetical protein WJX73_000434 [Symbiochloris irregularis]|uniref:Transmembrane protein 209 n=1 Tax=Symbiochloris irregularis TaxID=706552 RepID=A0AAW1P451_9CHLO
MRHALIDCSLKQSLSASQSETKGREDLHTRWGSNMTLQQAHNSNGLAYLFMTLPEAALQASRTAASQQQPVGRVAVGSVLPVALSALGTHLLWTRTGHVELILAEQLQAHLPLLQDVKAHQLQTLLAWCTGACGYVMVLWLLALGLGRLAVLGRKVAPPSKWEKDLGQQQRLLFGLSPGKAATAPVRQTKEAEPRTPPSALPCGPPLHNERTVPSAWHHSSMSGTPIGARPSAEAQRVPYSRTPPLSTPPHAVMSHQGAASPYSPSPSVVSTPAQLRRYMDAMDEPFSSPNAAANGKPSPPGSTTGFASQSPLPGGSTSGFNNNHNTSQSPYGGVSTPHGLGPHPKYQPSLQPRDAPAPLRGDTQLLPSSQQVIDALLQRLQCNRDMLDAWTERLREWFAQWVIGELLRLLSKSHKDVTSSAAKLGAPAIRCDPLDIAEAIQGNDLAQLRQQLTQMLSQQGGTHTQQTPLLYSCLEAIHTHQSLNAFLNGDSPHYMLPTTPRGYIISRLRDLGKGSCLQAYVWNGGGEWGGRPWTPDLPTDSALLLYTFCAYLQSPRWRFSLDEPMGAGTTPLLFGALPIRPPDSFDGVLVVRPTSFPSAGNAVLALHVASRHPHFTLVMSGDITTTLCSYVGLFHTLLLFMQHARLERGGIVGGRTLDYLRMSAILRPTSTLQSLLPSRWLWC